MSFNQIKENLKSNQHPKKSKLEFLQMVLYIAIPITIIANIDNGINMKILVFQPMFLIL